MVNRPIRFALAACLATAQLQLLLHSEAAAATPLSSNTSIGEKVSPSSFDPAKYTPAIVSLSFTQSKEGSVSTQKGANAFLDVTLIPLEGEPIGQRVELDRARFQDLLRTLYRQLARQDSLQVHNPQSPARQLYGALIGPIASELAQKKVTTLMISADRGLQAVPFAALHDGQQYLGEKLAFSVTPSITLTSLAPPKAQRGTVLAAGAANFSTLAPLPLVPQELSGIAKVGPTDQYLNQAFSPKVLLDQAADDRYSRVHVATHAEFLPGGPSQAKLHTGTGAISMKEFVQLRQRRKDNPLELFSLSACRTALGDNDAELGFAGLALQAGARSAIGTLWYVDDVATSAFFLQFYRYLDAGIPKADALKATRIAMANGLLRLSGDQILGVDGAPLLSGLTSEQQRRVAGGMRHPFFWSGIELLGTPW